MAEVAENRDVLSDRSTPVGLPPQIVIHACPCGATADGTMPERLIHRGNCPWGMQQTRAVSVVTGEDYDRATARLRAENERLHEALTKADLRFEQICRDRRERDKVFVATTTARAEISRALDEIQAGGSDGPRS